MYACDGLSAPVTKLWGRGLHRSQDMFELLNHGHSGPGSSAQKVKLQAGRVSNGMKHQPSLQDLTSSENLGKRYSFSVSDSMVAARTCAVL